MSKKYKAEKIKLGGKGEANLELYGDMLGALDYKQTDEGIELGFFGDQADKADGHLKFSGRDNNTPQRRFLPGEGEHFKKSIETQVQRIISDKLVELIDPKEFEGITSTQQLYDTLSNLFEDLTRSELKLLVSRNKELYDVLDELDLLDKL